MLNFGGVECQRRFFLQITSNVDGTPNLSDTNHPFSRVMLVSGSFFFGAASLLLIQRSGMHKTTSVNQIGWIFSTVTVGFFLGGHHTVDG